MFILVQNLSLKLIHWYPFAQLQNYNSINSQHKLTNKSSNIVYIISACSTELYSVCLLEQRFVLGPSQQVEASYFSLFYVSHNYVFNKATGITQMQILISESLWKNILLNILFLHQNFHYFTITTDHITRTESFRCTRFQ